MNRVLFVQLIALAPLLSGCPLMPTKPDKPDPVVTIQTVDIPVPVACKVAMPAKPTTPPIGSASAPAGAYPKAQGVLTELEEQRKYAHLLEIALQGCRKTP